MPLALDLPVFSVVLVAAWLLIFGGSVGSFLNVVAYRLPLGLSLVRPPSHCPACKTPIAWHDNVPVLGWLWLRGRCRACRVWISPRYPLVEAVAAAMFLAVGWREIVAGGANLPHDPVIYDGQVVSPAPLFVRAVLCGYHLLLLSTLLPAALMEIDGRRLPWRLGWPAAAVGLAASVAFAWVHPLHALRTSGSEMLGPLDAAAGLAAGCLAAWALARLTPADRRDGLWLGLPLVGLFLGWQMGLAIALALGLILAVLRLTGRRFYPAVWLCGLTLIALLAWSAIPLLRG